MFPKNVSHVLPAEALIEAQKEYLLKIYAWMVGGLLVTGITALFFASSDELMITIWSNTLLRWGVLLAPLGMVFALSGWIDRMSVGLASAMFVVYSMLTGIMLSSVFWVYTPVSIATTFFIASGMFATMSIYGFITKADLSEMGSFMRMGLIGLILACVVNWWLESSALHFAISIIGVLVFTGLTAYDTQKLKEAYVPGMEVSEQGKKAAVIGALTLYLDFINLFLFLLRLLGSRR